MRSAMPRLSGSEHAWERGLALWHSLFVGLIVLGTLLGLLDGELTQPELLTAIAVAVLMTSGYHAFFIARLPWTHLRPASLAYLALMALGWAILLRQSPTYLWLQLSLFSQVFFMLPARWSVPVVFLVASIGVQSDVSQRPGPVTDHLPAIVTTLSITAFLAVFGAWISTIVEQSEERHVLIEQLEATRGELAEQERLAGVQAERQRMAQEIHDTVAQDLTAIVMQLRAAGEATDAAESEAYRAEAQRIAHAGLAEARRTVWALRPSTLEAAGLVEALQRIVREWHPHDRVRADLVVSGDRRALHADLEVTLLRAVQEGLANVARHAQARAVTVTLAYLDDAVALDIHDDGIGFVAREAPVRRRDGGLGLVGMRERAEQLGGSVAVESTPGYGTTVAVRLPLAAP